MSQKKKNKSNFSGKKFLSGLVFGGVLGATVTFLSAPNSGKNTRERIKSETKNNIQLVKEVKTDIAEVKINTNELQDTTKELLPEFLDGTKKAIRAFQFRATPRITDIRKQLEKIKVDLDNLSNL